MLLMYLRKSRADDTSLTVNEVLAKHEQILQEYCVNAYGKKLDERYIYREIVSAETIEARPLMKKLIEQVTSNDVEGVLVVEPQRLSRGDLMDCGQIMRIFKYTNTKIITPNKTFDLNDKYDYKFFQMELMQGNEYLEYTKAILQRGRNLSRQKGCYLGSRPPYGYNKVKIDKVPTLQPNNEAPIIRLIFSLFVQGYGTSRICTELTERGIKPPRSQNWANSTIKKILTNELYIGKITHGKRGFERVVDESGNISIHQPMNQDYEVIDGLHQPIVDEKTFCQVQKRIGRLSRETKRWELKNAYAGLLKCSCGYSFIRQQIPGRSPNLYCTHRKYCHNQGVKYDVFTDLLVSQLKAQIQDFSVNIEEEPNNELFGLVNALKSELQATEKQQDRLYELLEKGLYSEEVFKTRAEKLSAERDRLTKAIQKAEEEATKKEHQEAFSITLHQAVDTLADGTISAKAKNTFLKGFIDHIVYDGQVHIYYL